MKKILWILLIALFLFGCDGSDGEDGDDGKDGIDGNDGVTIEYPDDTGVASQYALNGKAENAACKKPGQILVYPLDSKLYQTGDPIFGYIKNDTGSFDARGTASGQYALYVADNLTCVNEVSAGIDTGIMFFSLADLTEEERNISPLTTIEYLVGIEYFDDISGACYHNVSCAINAAHTAIINYFQMPQTDVKFSQMTLQGDREADAILGIVNSMIANGRSAVQQNSYMLEIANGVLSNDLALKADIQNQFNALPIKTIKTNLENLYTSLGLGALCPPIWDLPFLPDYYADILTRTPTVLEWINQAATTQISFDSAGFNSFAYPTIFNSIEAAVYFASELDGDISIWSVGTCNQGTDYPCPLAQLVTVEELNEILLEPVLIYNGKIPENSLVNGSQYFTVQNFDDLTHTPSHAADGDMLPFGRNLAAVDNNWAAAVGWNNTTTWFRRSPKMFLTN